MSYDADLNFNYFGPTKVVFGPGTLVELPLEVAAFGRRAVLVTDAGVTAAGLADRAREALGSALVGTFDAVPQDSGMDVVDRGAAFARSVEADVLVSIGGGSVIDTAKGMCILLTEGGSMRDYQGVQMLTRPQTPHIVVPTTAGTGSEVTAGSVILDREQGQKIINFESYNTPRVAILDPVLTRDLPPELTATTGMDALTHAIESYVSLQRNPISDAAALHAIRLIGRYLPRAVASGGDLTARGQMQIAALLAGWAFSNAMVGLVHAMAHSLGATCGVPHGLANSILLPHVMTFNLEEAPDLMADIAGAMGVATRDTPPQEAGRAAVVAVYDLLKAIGLDRRLSDLGVAEDRLMECSELSVTDGSIIYNPRMVIDAEEVFHLYRKAF